MGLGIAARRWGTRAEMTAEKEAFSACLRAFTSTATFRHRVSLGEAERHSTNSETPLSRELCCSCLEEEEEEEEELGAGGGLWDGRETVASFVVGCAVGSPEEKSL